MCRMPLSLGSRTDCYSFDSGGFYAAHYLNKTNQGIGEQIRVYISGNTLFDQLTDIIADKRFSKL